MVQACAPSTGETEAGESQVPRVPALHKETKVPQPKAGTRSILTDDIIYWS